MAERARPVAEALLDTSVIIDPPENLAALAERTVVSAISLAELAAGLERPQDPVERTRRQQRYERVSAVWSPIAFGSEAARIYGALCESMRRGGRNPRPRQFDLLIAATASVRGVPIITRNPDDFSAIHSSIEVIAVR